MLAAETNIPVGRTYNLELERILKRERLVEHPENPKDTPFPDKNTRKDAATMVANLHHPAEDVRRLAGILAWRAGLDPNVCLRLNHPTAVLRAWRRDTEPQIEKDAKRKAKAMQAPEENPLAQALADTEGEFDDARARLERVLGLLQAVIDSVPDALPADLHERIVRELAGSANGRQARPAFCRTRKLRRRTTKRRRAPEET